MLKYLAILSLGLCACGGAVNTPAPEVAHQSVLPPVVRSEASETTVDVQRADSTLPITVELAHGRKAQVLRCTDELDCYQKLSGVCPNGYNGGQTLAGKDHSIVGTIFRCVTNEEKAEMDREAAEQKAQMEAYVARAAAAEKAAQEDAAQEAKKQQKSPKAPAKK